MTNKYSHQLIETLSSNIEEQLLDKFDEIFENTITVNSLIENILNEVLEGKTGKEDIKTATTMINKLMAQKRVRWIKSIKTNQEKYKEDSLKSYFHKLYQQQQLLTKEQWKQLYQKKTIEDLKKETIDRAEEWKKQKGYLTDFPLFHEAIGEKMKEDALKQDLFINISEILKEKYHGSIDYYFKNMPEFITETPIFGENNFDLFLPDIENHRTEDKDDNEFYRLFENRDYQLIIQSKERDAKMLDIKDVAIMNDLISSIKTDFYSTKNIHTSIGRIAQVLAQTDKPSKFYYEMAEDRLRNMINLQYTYQSEKKEIIFNLLQGIVFEKKEKNVTGYVDITVSDFLFDALLQQKMIDVTTDNYNKLENKLSQLFCFTFQKERVSLHGEPSMKKNYEYDWFTRSITFKTNNKRTNTLLIKECLEEYKRKEIVIKDYSLKRGLFTIEYIPLSESEIADLKK